MSIQVRNLSHIYNKGLATEHVALDNINFDIYDGEIVGIIGHTGSGKSTLLQHLNGLLRAESGNIIVGGTDITKPGVAMRDIRRRVGLVFQYPEYQLFEETVAKDVAFGPKNLGLAEEEVENRVREALEMVGIDYEVYGQRSPFELSGGQKRRVAIAGVVAMKPQVLILDEPTAGLDPLGRKELMNLFKKLHQSGMTIVLVTHLMDDVAEYANQVYVMEKGRLVKGGKPSDVFQDVVFMEEVQLGVPKITAFCKRLADRGVSFKRLPIKIEEFKESLNG